MTRIHPQARTTPKTRAEIQAASGSNSDVAELFNISVATVRKWRSRAEVQDRSHHPNRLSTTLSPAQEAIVVELRRLLMLPLDDLFVITREFINDKVSRAGLERTLRRHGVSQLRELREASSCDFLWRVHQAAPMKIVKVLTDNGSPFTDRYTGKSKQASGAHAFVRRCQGLEIEHRLAPPRHPQTNGMVERFNARSSEVVGPTRFKSRAEREATLMQYAKTYNHHIPERALDHLTPVQAVKKWRESRPELRIKTITGQPSLDI